MTPAFDHVFDGDRARRSAYRVGNFEISTTEARPRTFGSLEMAWA